MSVHGKQHSLSNIEDHSDSLEWTDLQTEFATGSANWNSGISFADANSRFVELSGDSMTGNLTMGNNDITNINVISANEIHTLSAYTHYQDIIVSELSGFSVEGNVAVDGNVAVSGLFITTTGDSDDWNSNYTTVNSNSADWGSAYTSVNGASGDWDSVYTSVNDTSANWNSAYAATTGGIVSQAFVQTNFVNISGDTMTGNLTSPFIDSQNIGNIMGTGLVSGGYITTTFGTSAYNIAAGEGYVVDNYTDPTNPVINHVTWGNKSGIIPGGLHTLNTQFIGICANGDYLERDSLPSEIEMRDFIYLGKLLIAPETDLTVFGLTFPRMKYQMGSQLDDINRVLGVTNIYGNMFTANGDNLSLDKSTGETYRVGANYPNSYKNPSLITNTASTSAVFSESRRDGAGSFDSDGLVQDLTPGFYDDGTGTLAVVAPTYFTIKRVYYFTNNSTFITYGQVLYPNLNEALLGTTTEDPIVEEQFTTDASLRALIVIRGDATDLVDSTKVRIVTVGNGGEITAPGGAVSYDSKSVGIITTSTGDYYTHGYYDAPETDSNLTQASTQQTQGIATRAYGAHAFIVASGAGTASGGAGTVQIAVSGASINEEGVKVDVDTEILTTDVTAMTANQYFETEKKWIGQITFNLENSSGSTQTTYTADFNYGFAKYEDWGNREFRVNDFEFVWTAGAGSTGTDFNCELLHHRAGDWIYDATAFQPGNGALVNMKTDYGVNNRLTNGESYAYKRANLSTLIRGNLQEGLIVRITAPVTAAVEIGNINIGVEFV